MPVTCRGCLFPPRGEGRYKCGLASAAPVGPAQQDGPARSCPRPPRDHTSHWTYREFVRSLPQPGTWSTRPFKDLAALVLWLDQSREGHGQLCVHLPHPSRTVPWLNCFNGCIYAAESFLRNESKIKLLKCSDNLSENIQLECINILDFHHQFNIWGLSAVTELRCPVVGVQGEGSSRGPRPLQVQQWPQGLVSRGGCRPDVGKVQGRGASGAAP